MDGIRASTCCQRQRRRLAVSTSTLSRQSALLHDVAANEPPTDQWTPLTPPQPRPRLLTAPSTGAPAPLVGSHGDRKSIVQRAPAVPDRAGWAGRCFCGRTCGCIASFLAELADIVADRPRAALPKRGCSDWLLLHPRRVATGRWAVWPNDLWRVSDLQLHLTTVRGSCQHRYRQGTSSAAAAIASCEYSWICKVFPRK